QRAGPLWKLETADALLGHVWRTAADHVPDVQLGHLVARQIRGLVAPLAQGEDERVALVPRARRYTHENLRPIAAAQPVVELRDDARAERAAEFTKRAGAFRNGDGKQRLVPLAQLGPFGDEPQSIEVHVRAAQHRREL